MRTFWAVIPDFSVFQGCPVEDELGILGGFQGILGGFLEGFLRGGFSQDFWNFLGYLVENEMGILGGKFCSSFPRIFWEVFLGFGGR